MVFLEIHIQVRVFNRLVCAEIFSIGFLHQGITAVFLISEDAADSTGRPEVITHGRFDPLLCQGSGYFRWRCALQAAFIDVLNNRLLFPFRYPINCDTLYFGGMDMSIWM